MNFLYNLIKIKCKIIINVIFLLLLNFNYLHGQSFEISGQIINEKKPLSRCKLSVIPNNVEIISDENGFYHVLIQKGWSGKIIPVINKYNFSPRSYQYINIQSDLVHQNYQAKLQPENYFYPPKIAGPKTGNTWEALSFHANTNQDNISGLKYLFIWCDQTKPEWSENIQTNIWKYPGYYCVRVKVKNNLDQNSNWSDCHLVKINEDKLGNKPPIIPSISGITNGITGLEYEFYAATHDPDGKIPIYYRFKIDKSISDWQLSNMWKQIWSKEGTYIIRAQAKDNFGAISNQSDYHRINIEKAYTPEKPQLILSQYSVSPGLSITLKARSIDGDGDNIYDKIQYQFDFGDNSISDWIRSQNQYAYADHSWYTTGTYCVKVMAKDDSGLKSPYSDCVELIVKFPNSLPITPTISGPEIGYTQTEYEFIVNSFDENGDELEYLLEIQSQGNENPDFKEVVFDWQLSNSFHYSFDIAGNYIIKAAVQEKDKSHPCRWSSWFDIAIHSNKIIPKIEIDCPTPSYSCSDRCNGKYPLGKPLKIIWDNSGGINENRIKNVTIFYSINENNWIKIGESDSSSFEWQIPQDFNFDYARIKLFAEFSIGTAETISEPLAFYDPSLPKIQIKVESDKYYINEPVTVQWQIECASGYEIENAKLEFYKVDDTYKTIEHLNKLQAQHGSFTWTPDNCRYQTNSGQFYIHANCSNCQENEALTDKFSIQFRPDISNNWNKTEYALEIKPNPDYFQYLEKPNLFVDSKNNIHVIAIYRESSKGINKGQYQIYYRKKSLNTFWENLEQATNYPVWENNHYQIDSPDIAVDFNATPHIVYKYTPPKSEVTQIYYSQKKNNSWTEPENLSEITENYTNYPKIIVNQNNDVYVFWREKYKGILFRVQKNSIWSKKEVIPNIYDNYDITIDNEDIIHIAGSSAESKTYYLTLNGQEFSEPELMYDSSLSNNIKILASNQNIYISDGWGTTLKLFRKINNTWDMDIFQIPEANSKSFFMFNDKNSNLHIIYSGNHNYCDVMMERILENNEWQNYQPVSNYFLTNIYTISNNTQISGIVWDGRFENQDIIFFSFLSISD